jgi:exonuclease III
MTKKLLCPLLLITYLTSLAQTDISPAAYFNFNKTTLTTANTVTPTVNGKPLYTKSFAGNGLHIQANSVQEIEVDKSLLQLNTQQDYSVQFWVKTKMPASYTMPLVSQKNIMNTSLSEQKKPGWLFYFSGGTWAFNIGTGKRRITYERENGHIMPLNDGRWHQLTMTYNSKAAQLKLFYDGDIKAQYFLGDSVGFHLKENIPFTIGRKETDQPDTLIQATIQQEAVNLQKLVDAFTTLGAGAVADKDYMLLLTDPKKLYSDYVAKKSPGMDAAAIAAKLKEADFTAINKIRSELMRNPYTVHQVIDFVEVAPVTQLYGLQNGRIIIQEAAKEKHISSRRLRTPDFEIDELKIWNETISEGDVQASWTKFFTTKTPPLVKDTDGITVANWNIWHGGKHFTVAKDGYDSRKRIVEMIQKENADVVMLQETYSSGEFIAAELGYYYAASADWDYLNQGSNISVLSRFPIKEVQVPAGAPFMNLGAKIALSKTQDIYIMSNWYGMNQFVNVYDFHKNRFAKSDSIPVIFAGDFNAVPAVDGGKENPASIKLTAAGFTDAYRQLYPNISTHPGYSHIIGERIDQLYYKGRALQLKDFKLITTWPGGYPSDHGLMIARFGWND